MPINALAYSNIRLKKQNSCQTGITHLEIFIHIIQGNISTPTFIKKKKSWFTWSQEKLWWSKHVLVTNKLENELVQCPKRKVLRKHMLQKQTKVVQKTFVSPNDYVNRKSPLKISYNRKRCCVCIYYLQCFW